MTLDPRLQKLLIPALAGAAGTGMLGAYISKNYKPENESPRERRNRIMRSGLLSAALGGAAGGGIPAGVEMLSEPFQDSSKMPLLDRGIDAAVNTGASHAAGIGAGIAGGAAVSRINQRNRGVAQKSLLGILKGDDSGINNIDELKSQLSSPEGTLGAMSDYARRVTNRPGHAGTDNLFYANELLQEAGNKGLGLSDMTHLLGQHPNLEQEYAKYLGNQGMVGKAISQLGRFSKPLSHLDLRDTAGISQLAEHSPTVKAWLTRMAEFRPSSLMEPLGRFIRPGVGKQFGRVNPAVWAALAGAGALTAQGVQNRIAGN